MLRFLVSVHFHQTQKELYRYLPVPCTYIGRGLQSHPLIKCYTHRSCAVDQVVTRYDGSNVGAKSHTDSHSVAATLVFIDLAG